MPTDGYSRNLQWQCKVAGLPEPAAEVRVCPERRWRFDLAWTDRKVAIEVDGAIWKGGRHTRGAGFERDCEKLNHAVVLGWRILRFSTGQVTSGVALQTVERLFKHGPPQGDA